jgi:hypothetical protein
MGIFVGWIVQKRWLTLTAFMVLIIGFFTLPRLPVPISYLVFLLPVLFLMALLYEGSGQFGLRLGPRLRLAWVLWMGFSTGVLMAGIVLGGSSQAFFVASVAAFAVLTVPSIIAIGMIHGRRLREEQSTSRIAVRAEAKGK